MNHLLETLGSCVWVIFLARIWVTVDVSLWNIVRRTPYDLYNVVFLSTSGGKVNENSEWTFCDINKNHRAVFK